MATAPVPGRARADAQEQAEAATVIRMTMGDQTLELIPSTLTLQERFVIRQSTGLPFEAFFAGGEHVIGEDSVAVLWWLARRANGEANLPFRQSAAEWKFDPETFDIEVVEDDDEVDRPEG